MAWTRIRRVATGHGAEEGKDAVYEQELPIRYMW